MRNRMNIFTKAARKAEGSMISETPVAPPTPKNDDKRSPKRTIIYNESSHPSASDPFSPPSSNNKRKRGFIPNADRFISNRESSDLESHYLLHKDLTSPNSIKRTNYSESDAQTKAGDKQYNQVLVNESFPHCAQSDPRTPHKLRVFNHFSPAASKAQDFLPCGEFTDSVFRKVYSTLPISLASQKLLNTPRIPLRHIPKIPYKVLDAPDLQDDFYLNLVDWGENNILSVGLSSCVYLWAANSSKVTKLCDLSSEDDTVTSVAWNKQGNKLAVGTNKGFVKIYDVSRNEKVSEFHPHTARVGALSWSTDLLASGSRDRSIQCIDINRQLPVRKMNHHTQEVCGLKWNSESTQLASGGNDNKLLVWDKNSCQNPLYKLNEHTAAVKAIAWSPFNGMLASGGGTADKHIRFWNTLTGTHIRSINTDSQVCNLAWSKTSNELVSTHGYSQNQIVVWNFNSMTPLSTLTGHTMRVLYLAMSPCGQNIVTGAGDETLRFWSVFPKGKSQTESRVPISIR